MLEAGADTEGKKFSRREWLLLVALLLMLEAWILNVSYAFHADKAVIDYISFAATVASLLLAVIAIIYGFYQADGQQKSAVAIAAQIDSMRQVQRELNQASSGVSEQLEGIASTAAMLKSLGEAVEATHNRVAGLEGGLSGVAEEQRKASTALEDMRQRVVAGFQEIPRQVSSKVEVDKVAAAKILFMKASPSANLLAVSLNELAQKKDGKFNGWLDFIDKHYDEPLKEALDEKKKATIGLRNWLIGMEMLMIARAFGLVAIEVEGEQALKVEKDIIHVLKDAAQKAVEAERTKVAAGKIIESFSQ